MRGSVWLRFNGEWRCAPWQYSSALQTKHDTYGYAKGYVAIVAGHIHESEKNTHIRKGGRNVQKHI
jgi:hypothetical protein